MKEQKYKILNQEKKDGLLNLEVEIDYQVLEKLEEQTLEKLSKDVELKGFRKGTAPLNLIKAEIGEQKILSEQAFLAIENVLPEIMVSEKINALTFPQISITKLAKNNPLTFKAIFTLMPEVEVADYKKIAKEVNQKNKKEESKVEEKEIDDYIEYLRKMRISHEGHNHKPGEKCDHEENLPEFNDEFVKTLGNFKNVDEFKNQLRENILAEKKRKQNEKNRLDIVEKIISDSKINLPELLINEELDRMFGQFKHDIENMKMKPEDYLKEIKKTEDDLKKEWRPDAEKRAKMNLILPKIAEAEKIVADKEQVEKEVKALVEMHKVPEQNARPYVEHVLKNEAVFKFLEEQK